MANNINLASKYIGALDSAYKNASKTSILDVSNALIKETPAEKSILIPKMTLEGLSDYGRNTGYVASDVALEWVTYTLAHDRGASFQVDRFDNAESAGQAFGALAGEFIKQHVVPEVDCYKISKLATDAGNVEEETLTSANVVSAVNSAISTLDDAEVPETDRVMLVSVATYQLMKESTQISKKFDVQTNVANLSQKIETFEGMPIVKVPSSRMKTKYTFGAKGFTVHADAVDINFMIVAKSSQVSLVKTASPRIFSPEVNQGRNAWKFDYRLYMDCFVLDNKDDGIYVSVATDAS